MASSFTLPSLQYPFLIKSQFLGQIHLPIHLHRSSPTIPTTHSTIGSSPCANFDLFKIMEGRGLCNGEEGLQQELKRNISEQSTPPPATAAKDQENPSSPPVLPCSVVPEKAFEKELFGLTGGFPGGEKGLQQFIEKNLA
ncbi:NAD(P)H-quinone oxidoreductase subunit S, chloroplastic [Malania oleifera]|uniref:NAD(P)H-quinone oxidoreductase subunit S, chloroplastic n=1 Tax=Malania oleifera TaxID=397392 RepID=UPI0025AE0C47|nr:NAD(P)H-quinone oxidoreductase subunit S, chloroplastic [Malania oleifera]